jgi:hypothetical protein
MFVALALGARHWGGIAIAMFGFTRNTGSLRRANFDLTMELLGALFGMPIFAYLLLLSKRAHANGSVAWKGRKYSDHGARDVSDSKPPRLLLSTDN